VKRLAEELLEDIKKRIKESEAHLKTAKYLIDKLRAAGEDVTKLQTDYQVALQRLERYKRAFGVK